MPGHTPKNPEHGTGCSASIAAVAVAILVASSLAACTAKLEGSNERGGIIKMPLGFDKRVKAFNLAQENCAKHGRVAVETGHSEWDNTFRYECREK